MWNINVDKMINDAQKPEGATITIDNGMIDVIDASFGRYARERCWRTKYVVSPSVYTFDVESFYRDAIRSMGEHLWNSLKKVIDCGADNPKVTVVIKLLHDKFSDMLKEEIQTMWNRHINVIPSTFSMTFCGADDTAERGMVVKLEDLEKTL